MTYEHCVFGCSNKYPENITPAIKVANLLDLIFSTRDDVAMCHYSSDINIVYGNYNTEIYMKNDNLHTLINDCMEFSREIAKLERHK